MFDELVDSSPYPMAKSRRRTILENQTAGASTRYVVPAGKDTGKPWILGRGQAQNALHIPLVRVNPGAPNPFAGLPYRDSLPARRRVDGSPDLREVGLKLHRGIKTQNSRVREIPAQITLRSNNSPIPSARATSRHRSVAARMSGMSRLVDKKDRSAFHSEVSEVIKGWKQKANVSPVVLLAVALLDQYLA
jgi:hypothetical protein